MVDPLHPPPLILDQRAIIISTRSICVSRKRGYSDMSQRSASPDCCTLNKKSGMLARSFISIWFFIEGYSATIISWINESIKNSFSRLIVRDIGHLLQSCVFILIDHVACYTISVLWSNWHTLFVQFRNLESSELLDCIHFCSTYRIHCLIQKKKKKYLVGICTRGRTGRRDMPHSQGC